MNTPAVQIGMPLDEFIRLYESDGPFELVNGERIVLMPTVAGHGYTLKIIYFALSLFAAAQKLGEVLSELPFVVSYTPNWVTGSRVPDVMFYTADRMQAYKAQHTDWKQKPYILVPDLAVEVVSPNDDLVVLDDKIDNYLADGVHVVWAIDPDRQRVSVYTLIAPQPFTRQQTSLKVGDTLMGGDLLPGFEIAVSDLF